jgi:hypothetical protein
MKTEDRRFPRADGRTAEEHSRLESPAEWRLPSGRSLAEFASDSGLLARRLIEPRKKGAAGHGRGWVREN